MANPWIYGKNCKKSKNLKTFYKSRILISKLFLKAISLMQKDPKKAIELYGKNTEFMEIFKEFCKEMGNNF